MEKMVLQEIAEALQLTNLTPEIGLDTIYIDSTEINRPALQLAGYYDFFDERRIQVIGKVEYAYLQTLSDRQKEDAYRALFSRNVPCLVMARDFQPSEAALRLAREHGVPVLSTDMSTSRFLARVMRLLEVRLAPMMAIHGVLVDVCGEGVLIIGESGLGKSEAALELVKRGHRLVADDAVELRRLSENELVGSAPAVTRNLMELRGIGIIDIKALFGVASVKDEMPVSMVVRLKAMNQNEPFERLGAVEEYVEYLGNRLNCYTVPVSPGRNIAVIVETAAINFRTKRMGYDAMAELQRRIEAKLQDSLKEDF